jgi:hypothetical protein
VRSENYPAWRSRHERLQYLGGGTLHYLRSRAGAEVDDIIARGNQLVEGRKPRY